MGELLRREGLYTSHLTYWRKQRKDGALKELGRPRGRKPVDRREQQIAELTRRTERLEGELAKGSSQDMAKSAIWAAELSDPECCYSSTRRSSSARVRSSALGRV